MKEKFGIKNLKYLIALPVELGNIADSIGSESINWRRWFKLVDILGPAVDLLKVDWSMVKKEYEDLDEAEQAEIKEFVAEKFDIHNDKLEAVIEESFSMLFSIGELISNAIALFKNIK